MAGEPHIPHEVLEAFSSSHVPQHEQFSGDDFTEDERRYLRRMMRADDRKRWLAQSIKVVVVWGGAVAVGITTSYTFIRDALRAISH